MTIKRTTRIPTKTQREAPKRLSDRDLAARYMNLVKASSDDGNETAFLEDEMRHRWLIEQGFDLRNAFRRK